MTRTRRVVAALGGATAVATAALVAATVIGPAGATDDPGGDADGTESSDDRFSVDDFRACMEDQGVALPERGSGHGWGGDADPLSGEERESMRAAAEECGLPGPGAFGRGAEGFARGGFGHGPVGEEMRACAEASGVDLPEEPGDDRPELTDEQREALEACAEEERAARHEELAQCVEEQGSTLPDMPEEPGDDRPELSDEQRAALQTCAEELDLPHSGGRAPGFRGHHGGAGGPGAGHGMMRPCDPAAGDGANDAGSETDDPSIDGSFWEA